MRTLLLSLILAAACAAQQTQATQSTTTTTDQRSQTTTVTTTAKSKRPKRKAKKEVTKSSTTTAAALPKTAPELQNDIQAKLKSGRLVSDPINVLVQGNTITLTGFVSRAEHKGVATRQARVIARQDGWKDFHVDNQLQVQSR